jgi:hypothetical protein
MCDKGNQVSGEIRGKRHVIRNFCEEEKRFSGVNARFLAKREGKKMKKLLFILFVFIFASSASATVYKWADDGGVMNFTDDYSKVPPDYRNKAEEVSMPKTRSSTLSQPPPGNIAVGKQSGGTATQQPAIAQPLTREGDFAIKLAEALKIGQAKNEAEAESTLASAGVAPKNGWIADYPVTPDIVGELQNAVGMAADSGKLGMKKEEALKAFRTTAVELELPITAEIPNGYAESPPPTASPYTEPTAIDSYYDSEGPPVVTYYPPPPDYYYMYAWVPSPFWCSGFFFPGFFILHDFHRVVHRHGHPCVITNHFRDHRTGRIAAIDPARRHAGGVPGGQDRRGFNSAEARKGASSILERSRNRVALNRPSAPPTARVLNDRNSAYSRPGRGTEGRIYGRGSQLSGLNGRNGYQGKPAAVDRRTNRLNGMSSQRSFASGSRSFSPSTGGGSQHSGPSGMGRGGSSGSHQGGSHSSGSGHGSSRF